VTDGHDAYFVVKDDSLGAECRALLLFLFSYVPLHVFEKGPGVARVPLADAAPEAGESQITVSQTAEGVRDAFLPVGVEAGEGPASDRGPPVEGSAAGAGVVDLSAVGGRPPVLLLGAFTAAGARTAEVASRLVLRDTMQKASADQTPRGLPSQGSSQGREGQRIPFHNTGKLMFALEW